MKHKLTRRGFIRTTAAGSVALGWLSARPGAPGVRGRGRQTGTAGGHAGPSRAVGPNGRSGASPGSPPSSKCCAAAAGSAAPASTWRISREAYAQLLGAKRCLATASGTTALIAGLHVMDVDAGDEVIVSPYTFIATYNAILNHKALPVFADTDPATLTMDPATIESRITERTRAIMPVHIFGMPCDMDPINAIAQKAQAGRDRGCLPGLAGGIQGPQVRHAGRPGLLQLPELQAHPVRRRRRRHRQQRRAH